MTRNGALAAVADEDPMAQLEALMVTVATGALPDRGLATAYSRCRAALLAGPADLVLPGFVHQCLTVFKFRDFITLYDPDVVMRETFVRRAFARCRMADTEPSPVRRAPAGIASSSRWRF